MLRRMIACEKDTLVARGKIRIVSGGQTGVDRGALDAALALGVTCGGWCPSGRTAEDGTMPAGFPLDELPGGRLPRTYAAERAG